MEIIVLIILAIISYTLFDVFASLSGNKLDSNLAAIIFNGLGTIIPFISYMYFKFIKQNKLIDTTDQGLLFAVIAGVSIAAFSILLVKIFEKGDLAYAIPLIYGGSIVLSVLVGVIILKNETSPLQIISTLLIALGVVGVIISKFNIK